MTADKTIELPTDHLATAAAAPDNLAAKLYDGGYHSTAGLPAGGGPSEGRSLSSSPACLPNCVIEGASTQEPQGFWSRMSTNASADFQSVVQGAENIGTNISETTDSWAASIKDTVSEAATFSREHPVEAMGYAAGAVVGGVVGVGVAAALAPVELGVGAVMVAGAVGAAAVDGAAYLLHGQIENALSS